MPNTYQVDTREVEVEVRMTNGATLRGHMFLQSFAALHAGAETVADRLNDAEPFFPLRVHDPDPATLLVGKAQIRYLVTSVLVDDERVAVERTAAAKLLVTVTLDDGEELPGTLLVALPPAKNRTLDFVNQSQLSFLLLARAGSDCYVNRSRVRHFRDTAV